MFADRREDWRFRWMAPLFNLGFGVAAGIAGIVIWEAGGPSSVAMIAATLGTTMGLCGLVSVFCRIRARLMHERADGLKQDLLADTATFVAFACLGLALVAWGGHGLSQRAAAGDEQTGLTLSDVGFDLFLAGFGLLSMLGLTASAARKARDLTATW